MWHNNSPSTVTGTSPSELIFSFKPKTLLDLIQGKNNSEMDKNEISEIKSEKKKIEI